MSMHIGKKHRVIVKTKISFSTTLSLNRANNATKRLRAMSERSRTIDLPLVIRAFGRPASIKVLHVYS